MDTQPEMLDFVKAVSDVERLRIIGALTRGPARAADIAENLGISFRDAIGHLAFLAFVNV
jgi:predicted ArsR family transcriptional regulator